MISHSIIRMPSMEIECQFSRLEDCGISSVERWTTTPDPVSKFGRSVSNLNFEFQNLNSLILKSNKNITNHSLLEPYKKYPRFVNDRLQTFKV